MIDFTDGSEFIEWTRTVRAALKGGNSGEAAVEIADYVIEQARARWANKAASIQDQ